MAKTIAEETNIEAIKKELKECISAYNNQQALLLETYRLFWQTTHRCPGLGSGTRRMITQFVEDKLKPTLGLTVTDQIDRDLIDGKE